MTLTVHIPPRQDANLVPDKRTLAEAGASGVCDLIVEHPKARNRTATHMPGMPRSNYWAEAADSVQVEMDGDKGTVAISKEGVALHFYGGIVLPTGGRKALAFPVHPAVAGKRAAEYDPGREKLNLVPGKNGKAATLRDAESEEVYYVLMRSLRLDADSTVLPTEQQMYDAAMESMSSVMEVFGC